MPRLRLYYWQHGDVKILEIIYSFAGLLLYRILLISKWMLWGWAWFSEWDVFAQRKRLRSIIRSTRCVNIWEMGEWYIWQHWRFCEMHCFYLDKVSFRFLVIWKIFWATKRLQKRKLQFLTVLMSKCIPVFQSIF